MKIDLTRSLQFKIYILLALTPPGLGLREPEHHLGLLQSQRQVAPAFKPPRLTLYTPHPPVVYVAGTSHPPSLLCTIRVCITVGINVHTYERNYSLHNHQRPTSSCPAHTIDPTTIRDESAERTEHREDVASNFEGVASKLRSQVTALLILMIPLLMRANISY